MTESAARVRIVVAVVVVVGLLAGWSYHEKVSLLEAERDRARASAQGWEREWRTLDEADLSLTDKVGGLTVPAMLTRLKQLPDRLRHQHEQGFERGQLSMCTRIYARRAVISLEDGSRLSYRDCVRGIAHFRGEIPSPPA